MMKPRAEAGQHLGFKTVTSRVDLTTTRVTRGGAVARMVIAELAPVLLEFNPQQPLI